MSRETTPAFNRDHWQQIAQETITDQDYKPLPIDWEAKLQQEEEACI